MGTRNRGIKAGKEWQVNSYLSVKTAGATTGSSQYYLGNTGNILVHRLSGRLFSFASHPGKRMLDPSRGLFLASSSQEDTPSTDIGGKIIPRSLLLLTARGKHNPNRRLKLTWTGDESKRIETQPPVIREIDQSGVACVIGAHTPSAFRWLAPTLSLKRP